MGVRYPSVQSNTFVGPLPANANETVIAITPPLTLPLDGATVIVMWMCVFLANTGTTQLSYKVRRGTTTAGQFIGVNSWAPSFAALATFLHQGTYFDTPGAVGGQQYALTVSQIGASAAGVVNDLSLIAFAL